MARVSQASGLIPQISVVAGNTSGIAAFAPTFADVLVVTQGTALHQAASHVAGAADDPQPTDDEAVLARALGRRVADIAQRLAR